MDDDVAGAKLERATRAQESSPMGARAHCGAGARRAEICLFAYHPQADLEVHVARIPDTQGPRMDADGDRVVSDSLVWAETGEPITHLEAGDHEGCEHRHVFCCVDELVPRLPGSLEGRSGLVDLGDRDESPRCKRGDLVLQIMGSEWVKGYEPPPSNERASRGPDASRGPEKLARHPLFVGGAGHEKTLEYVDGLLREG